MKSRSGRVLGWKNICHPLGKFFRPTKNVTLKEQITWKHLAGASEYIYPELDSTEVLEIKDKTGVSKLTLFPVLRERWGFNTGVTGWKENIEYLGSEVDKSRLYPLRDSGRFVLVYDRSELSSLPPEDIKKLITATCSQTKRWKMKMNPKKKINLSLIGLHSYCLSGFLWREKMKSLPSLVFGNLTLTILVFVLVRMGKINLK